MSHLLDQNEDLLAAPSRELTLSTGSILGIFFGLVLLCALFFGFGYNVGHRSVSAAASLSAHADPEVASAAPTEAAGDTFSSFKPAPAANAGKASPGTPEPAAIESEANASSAVAPARKPETTGATPAPGPHPASASKPAPATHGLAPPATVPVSAAAAEVPAGAFFVQVAAVSHPEDASLLMGALRARGYALIQHTDAADKLIHLQIGPLPSKPAAEAMRQRLQADGYNAIIK